MKEIKIHFCDFGDMEGIAKKIINILSSHFDVILDSKNPEVSLLLCVWRGAYPLWLCEDFLHRRKSSHLILIYATMPLGLSIFNSLTAIYAIHSISFMKQILKKPCINTKTYLQKRFKTKHDFAISSSAMVGLTPCEKLHSAHSMLIKR